MIGESPPLFLARIVTPKGQIVERAFRRVSFDKSHHVLDVVFLRNPTLRQLEDIWKVAPKARVYGKSRDREALSNGDCPVSSEEVDALVSSLSAKHGLACSGDRPSTRQSSTLQVTLDLDSRAFHLKARRPAASKSVTVEAMCSWEAMRASYLGALDMLLLMCTDVIERVPATEVGTP